jgi:hypothetical protein
VCTVASVEHRCLSEKCRGPAAHRRTDSFCVAPGASWCAEILDFAEELMAWCEANRVEYLLGPAKNERLKAEIAKELREAKASYQETGRAARLFKEFVYQTRESWSRARPVVAKAEHL